MHPFFFFLFVIYPLRYPYLRITELSISLEEIHCLFSLWILLDLHTCTNSSFCAKTCAETESDGITLLVPPEQLQGLMPCSGAPWQCSRGCAWTSPAISSLPNPGPCRELNHQTSSCHAQPIWTEPPPPPFHFKEMVANNHLISFFNDRSMIVSFYFCLNGWDIDVQDVFENQWVTNGQIEYWLLKVKLCLHEGEGFLIDRQCEGKHYGLRYKRQKITKQWVWKENTWQNKSWFKKGFLSAFLSKIGMLLYDYLKFVCINKFA